MNRLNGRLRALEDKVAKQVTLDDVLVHMEAGDYEEWAASLPVEAFHELDTYFE